MSEKYIDPEYTILRNPDGPIYKPDVLPQWAWDQYASASMNCWEFQKYVGTQFSQQSASIQEEFNERCQWAYDRVNHPDSSSTWVNTALSSSLKLFGRDTEDGYGSSSDLSYTNYQPFTGGQDWLLTSGSVTRD